MGQKQLREIPKELDNIFNGIIDENFPKAEKETDFQVQTFNPAQAGTENFFTCQSQVSKNTKKNKKQLKSCVRNNNGNSNTETEMSEQYHHKP